jgi:NTE family protein
MYADRTGGRMFREGADADLQARTRRPAAGPRPTVAPLRTPIAFVLPGGASWGAVQVGMLRALTAAGIRPDLLVATSVGALNAAVFAARSDAAGLDHLSQLWTTASRRQIFPVVPALARRALTRRRPYLFDNDGLRQWIGSHLLFRRLEDSAIPLHVMATDVETRAPVMLSSGDALTALLASSAIPGVFPAVTVDGRPMIDGGVAANHPVPQALALGAATVFALETSGRHPPGTEPIMVRVLDTLDRRFGRPVDPADDGVVLSLDQAGGARIAEPARRPGAEHAGPLEPVVHRLLPPPTVDVNPFGFRHSRRLIDEAEALARAWLAAHLPAGPTPAS